MLGKRVPIESSASKKICDPFLIGYYIRHDEEILVGASRRALRNVRCNQIKKELCWWLEFQDSESECGNPKLNTGRNRQPIRLGEVKRVCYNLNQSSEFLNFSHFLFINYIFPHTIHSRKKSKSGGFYPLNSLLANVPI